MHVCISGANGFVGKGLYKKLIQSSCLGMRPITGLTLVDIIFDEQLEASFPVQYLKGDIAQESWLKDSLSKQAIDCIFHLASVPGGTAEQNYSLARKVNLDGTQSLLELGKSQVEAGGVLPVFVFASSIAVFGTVNEHVNDQTPLRPNTTYGSQKMIGEILVEDFSRRGWVDGRSLRLPAVLARPLAPTGQLSAFLSNMLHELSRGKNFVCPTSASATTWASSLPCTVDNLLRAALINNADLERRSITLPTLHFSMHSLVKAMAELFEVPALANVSWQANQQIESLFAAFPTLDAESARAAGFVDDGDLLNLVRRSLM